MLFSCEGLLVLPVVCSFFFHRALAINLTPCAGTSTYALKQISQHLLSMHIWYRRHITCVRYEQLLSLLNIPGRTISEGDGVYLLCSQVSMATMVEHGVQWIEERTFAAVSRDIVFDAAEQNTENSRIIS